MLEWFYDLFRYIVERVNQMTFQFDLTEGNYIFYLPLIISIGAFIMYEVIKFFLKQVYR